MNIAVQKKYFLIILAVMVGILLLPDTLKGYGNSYPAGEKTKSQGTQDNSKIDTPRKNKQPSQKQPERFHDSPSESLYYLTLATLGDRQCSQRVLAALTLSSTEFVHKGLSIFSSNTAFYVTQTFYENLSGITSARLENKLIELLKDKRCQQAAMNSLAAINSHKAVPFLNEILLKDKEVANRMAAVGILTQIKDKRSLYPLIEAAKNDSDFMVRNSSLIFLKSAWGYDTSQIIILDDNLKSR